LESTRRPKSGGSRGARGLEDAIEDAALDVVLDTAVASAAFYSASRLRDIDKLDTIADSVGDGVEAAMRMSDVASTLDNAADVARTVKKINVARTVKKINKVRKLGR
jgi:transcription initiation factor TFIIIB Brf1 subunit/transcription initiation factor TFIIB